MTVLYVPESVELCADNLQHLGWREEHKLSVRQLTWDCACLERPAIVVGASDPKNWSPLLRLQLALW